MSSKSDTKTNIMAGIVQGGLMTSIGYPFDLIKTKMQSNRYSSSVYCLKQTIKSNGVFGLYKGSSVAWVSHMIKRPIQYSIAEHLKQSNLNLNNYQIGFVSGLSSPIIGTPLQVVKINMQSNNMSIREFINSGGLTRLYRGFWPTAIKDTVFAMSFVGTYYTLRDRLGSDIWYKSFICGSMSHSITWLIFIPIDNIKTTIQRSKEHLTIRSAIAMTYRAGKIKAFWKGVYPACLRTLPVSGISMVGYEMIRKN